MLAAADFELNTGDAANASTYCDPTRLTANPTIMDANGLSWGPNTLGSAAKKAAASTLLFAIFKTIGTPDAPGPGPSGSVGLHGWPNLEPRLTGSATNHDNNGPGVRAYGGGVVGFGADVNSSLSSGALNGELVSLYKAAAIADGVVTASSTNIQLGNAIATLATNPTSAVGLTDNIVQCALAISLGVDEDGVVIANPTAFVRNVVEDPIIVGAGGDSESNDGGASANDGGGGASDSGGIGTAGGGGSAAGAGGGTAGGSGGAGGAPAGGCPDLDQNGIADCRETLVANPGFDDATTNWTPATGGTASWTSVDGTSDPASGAIAVTNVDINPNDAVDGWVTTGASQCIPVNAGSKYEVALQAKLATGQGSGWAGFILDYFLAANCAGPPVSFPFLSSEVTTTGSWQTVSGTTTQIPLGVASVAVRLVVAKPPAQTSLEGLFDNVLVRVW